MNEFVFVDTYGGDGGYQTRVGEFITRESNFNFVNIATEFGQSFKMQFVDSENPRFVSMDELLQYMSQALVGMRDIENLLQSQDLQRVTEAAKIAATFNNSIKFLSRGYQK